MLLREQLAGDQPDWMRPRQHQPGPLRLLLPGGCLPLQGSFFDLVGNVWQWTSTAIDGFRGVQGAPLYDDFSTPTFDGKHTLIKGGSWISTGNGRSKSSRYAFRRHFFQHAGFRYLVSRHQEPVIVNPYETDTLVAQYLDFQYGPSHFGVANYAEALAGLASELCGAAMSGRSISAAPPARPASNWLAASPTWTGWTTRPASSTWPLTLARQDSFRYAVPVEGIWWNIARRASPPRARSRAERAGPLQPGDACNLKPKYGDYDLVLASNLIDRLREPARFLRDIAPRLRSGGLLVLTSPTPG